MEHNLRVLVLLSTIAATLAFGFNFGATDPPTTKAPVTTPAPALRQYDANQPRPDVPEPHYTFRYMVQDSRTGDYKSQEERRDGSHVRGTYSVAEPNGDLRVVSYSSDGDSGFRAEVRVEPAGAPTSQEARTFASFFPDPTAIFRTPTYFRSPIPANNKPNNLNRNITPDRAPQVQQNSQPSFAERPTQVPQNVFMDRPTQTPQNIYVDRPTQVPHNIYVDRPSQPQNMYLDRPTQGPQNIYVGRPAPSTQNLFAERPIQVAPQNIQNIFEQQNDDMNQMTMYPVFDGTRRPETQNIPITPASTYPLYNKPMVAEYNKDGNFYSGFRPHLPETPAIPITPPSPLEQQPDIITAPIKPQTSIFPKFSLFRRPTPIPTARPTPVPFRRYPTPTPYPQQQPFQFMRYSPAVYAPQPQSQLIQQQQQQQQMWQASNNPYAGFYGNGVQPPYMLVRTYLVPMPNGRPPTNMIPVPMEPVTQPITATTPIKTTAITTPVQTETPEAPVTTAQTNQTTI